jgi:ElaB/YqjD/DUF883 family membrane-anchored ribosome-binding protein
MARRSNGRNNNGIAKEIGRLRDDVAHVAQQLGTVADTAADGALDQVRTQMQRVKGGIDELFAEASDRGQDATVALRGAAETLSGALEDTVQRHPLTTLGLALGAGFLAGAAWRR